MMGNYRIRKWLAVITGATSVVIGLAPVIGERIAILSQPKVAITDVTSADTILAGVTGVLEATPLRQQVDIMAGTSVVTGTDRVTGALIPSPFWVVGHPYREMGHLYQNHRKKNS
jgi:hypothetical protein